MPLPQPNRTDVDQVERVEPEEHVSSALGPMVPDPSEREHGFAHQGAAMQDGRLRQIEALPVDQQLAILLEDFGLAAARILHLLAPNDPRRAAFSACARLAPTQEPPPPAPRPKRLRPARKDRPELRVVS